MGLVNGTVVLKNPRLPEVDPVEVEALADSGALHRASRSMSRFSSV
jgi:hypothetical protein